jgi:hypothetical protein
VSPSFGRSLTAIDKRYWFTQTFDHTSATDKRTFQQRYLIFDQYYRPGGPVYFCPGGEADVGPSAVKEKEKRKK